MKQNYFEYNGVRYLSGTQIKILRFPYNDQSVYDLAYFVYYNTESDTVWYRMAFTGQNRGCPMKNFMEYFIEATGKHDPAIHSPQRKRLKDSQIPGIMIGWLWYIFIMAITIIFKEAIGIWIIASVVFFNWRKNKIEKEGYYVER